MNPTITATARRVNAAECNAYRVPSPAVSASEVLVAQAADAGAVSDASAAADGDLDVADFVRQTFFQGVPFEAASQYGGSDVDTLLAMLGDPAEAPYQANIVVTLGAIGDDRAAEPLIGLIEAPAEGALTRDQYAAKASAFMALGMLVNQSGNRQALDFLQASLDPGIWEGSDAGLAPWQGSEVERNEAFATQAVLGLALTGSPEGEAALRSLKRTGRSQAQRAFQADAGNLVEEALGEHAKVAAMGLADYYQAAHE